MTPSFFMKVLITKTCAADGLHLESGQTYDVSDQSAKDLLKVGRAIEAPSAPVSPPKPKPKKPKVDVAK